MGSKRGKINPSELHTFLLHIAYQVLRDTARVSREQSTVVGQSAKNTPESFLMKGTLLHGNYNQTKIQID